MRQDRLKGEFLRFWLLGESVPPNGQNFQPDVSNSPPRGEIAQPYGLNLQPCGPNSSPHGFNIETNIAKSIY